ncbi:helix-turn-helix transcriptional regulator [Endozoicomonas sp. SM1973]|uniref:Helix-turn-helix transcriptional regulator n=1 Tax=Spartinivicinus marinus TaxID=2994442 RepID=A0A853IEC4_9GAMM|nr:helix-turn-helix transcriptional regulator [Spartinivicinus marinus]MCX4027872.1 helix-turn-helix transcriptional regulator [Spartinivicinus marinus]NYZ70192.1 helix-turn-helix transcriptional regulator [Spartinivicinus marinus]
MSEKKSELKDRIKSVRKFRLFTQEELGQKLGVTKSAVAAWETGRNSPAPLMLKELSKLLNCSLEWLSSDESEITGQWAERIKVEHPDKVDNENYDRNRIMEDVSYVATNITRLGLEDKLTQSDMKLLKSIIDIIEEREEINNTSK